MSPSSVKSAPSEQKINSTDAEDDKKDNSVGSERHVARDGRKCKLCNRSDGERCEVFPGELIYWGYHPLNGAPQGTVCQP